MYYEGCGHDDFASFATATLSHKYTNRGDKELEIPELKLGMYPDLTWFPTIYYTLQLDVAQFICKSN
jgi:hypothetical protein